MNDDIIKRAQGCLMGQLAGDSLGSLVEFQPMERILRQYPQGVRELADGGPFNLLAGQPTDDSEMALALARTLVERGKYDQEATRTAYIDWLKSGPFDVGNTVLSGLSGRWNMESQANGALMRVSPLGIFGARDDVDLALLADWAGQDAALTHVHPACKQANILFVTAIARAVRAAQKPDALYQSILEHARALRVEESLSDALEKAASEPPQDYVTHQGWVLIALQNAVWQLLHAPNLEEGIVDTVMRGGDTDTNAAIAGALLGAVYGIDAVPVRWTETILACRPEVGLIGVHNPRPPEYWPFNTLALAKALLSAETHAI